MRGHENSFHTDEYFLLQTNWIFFLEQKISLEIGKMKHEKLPFVRMELLCGGVDFTRKFSNMHHNNHI